MVNSALARAPGSESTQDFIRIEQSAAQNVSRRFADPAPAGFEGSLLISSLFAVGNLFMYRKRVT